MRKPKKIYPDYIIICGTTYDYITCVAQGSTLIKKVKRWGSVGQYWRPLDIEWVPWLQRLISSHAQTNGKVVYIRKEHLQELVLSCTAFGIPLANGFRRRGKLTDEEWDIISALPDSPGRAKYRAEHGAQPAQEDDL